ncbi:exported hypothetical protein [Desulfamplus magnetovallimortis]|uniref:Tetratricopeptide repeat protein n=1 Tax=Desulfamplus magnetovallimortis TaxID=1246637 RepID=A0A1W1HC01_9BACT|nr:tetratricopeptide repeat protein [Desulfamplus magnetovallimortis]SLM29908.1 exported hypothetical protein [Desulfamplus magnetovallimortis]
MKIPFYKASAIAIIAGLILVAMGWNMLLTLSRYNYQKGVNALDTERYDHALICLANAESFLPDLFVDLPVSRDFFRIYFARGQAMYHKATAAGDRLAEFELLEKSCADLKEAAALAPSSYRVAIWLAKVTARLELIFPHVHRDQENPYSALELYKTAAQLRPSGITVHYELLKYMSVRGITSGFDELAVKTVQIFPGAYAYLKKESFYTPALGEKIKEGVLKAAELEITPRTTYGVLSSIYRDEGDFDRAAFYYGESLRFSPSSNNYSHFLHLGWLFMKKGDMADAHAMYIKALKESGDVGAALNRIYSYYKNEDDLEGFMQLTVVIEDECHSSEELDLAMAKCRMDMELYGLARAILIRRSVEKPSAVVYGMLAEIALKEKDWDKMELAAQRATVFEPENSVYWKLFARALQNQRKFDSAEDAADRALDAAKSQKERAGILDQRAWIRWSAGDLDGALKDWQAVSAINPENPWFYYRISMACNRLGKDADAEDNARKALELKPDNETFIKWYGKMEKNLQK